MLLLFIIIFIIIFVMFFACASRIRKLEEENIKLLEKLIISEKENVEILKELVISEKESGQLWEAFNKVNQITTVDIIGIQTLAEAREGR